MTHRLVEPVIEASWGSAGKTKRVRTRVRWIVAVVVVLHGLIHLLGGVKGFGWAEVTALTEPISTLLGVAWLIAALLVVLAGVMLATAARSWWIVGAVAAVVSQGVILTSWTDAKAGTLVNVVLLVAAGYGYASQGPKIPRAVGDRTDPGIGLGRLQHAGIITIEAVLTAVFGTLVGVGVGVAVVALGPPRSPTWA